MSRGQRRLMRVWVPRRGDCLLATEDLELISNFRKFNEGSDGVKFVDSPNEADVIVVFEEFSFKLSDYREVLLECPVVRSWPQKIYTVNHDDHGRGHLSGCYTSLTTRNFDPVVHEACCYPKSYNEYAESRPANGMPRVLFSFVGTVSSHPVRRAMVRALGDCGDAMIKYVDRVFHQHTAAEKIEYVGAIVDSLFSLCPRGWSPCTYRLFEVMALGRCPVIISDEWVPIRGIEWKECSIRVREADIARIPALLAGRSDALQLGANARRVWEEHFSIEKRNSHYLRSIRGLHEKSLEGPPVRTADLYSRWNSWRFYWSNRWTVPQRAVGRVRVVMTSRYLRRHGREQALDQN